MLAPAALGAAGHATRTRTDATMTQRSTTHRPTARTARRATLAIIPLALVASGLIVSQASHAAFSATTSGDDNAWSMGSVALSDDTAQQAIFSAENLKPGSADRNCVAVTSSGTLPSEVRLYATDVAQTADLASHVTLQIRQGTGGGYGTCDGFAPAASSPVLFDGSLADFVTTSTSYGTGVGTWQPSGAGEETVVYEISYAIDVDAPASVMGASASLGFTWEAQNR